MLSSRNFWVKVMRVLQGIGLAMEGIVRKAARYGA